MIRMKVWMMVKDLQWKRAMRNKILIWTSIIRSRFEKVLKCWTQSERTSEYKMFDFIN